MGSVPAELSLDIRAPTPPPPPPPSTPSFIPKTITDFLSALSTTGITASEKQSRINGFLSHLEDEYNKIHAFKRELPLSMLLLSDAIVALKEELEKCSEGERKSEPVLEVFIPLKREFDHSEDDEEHNNNNNNNDNNNNNNNIRQEKECRDKMSWMSSVQLWNASSSTTLNNNNNNNAFDNNHKHHHQNHHHKFGTKKNQECVVENPFQSHSNVRNNGGRGFMPFTSYTSCSVPVTTVALSATKEEKEDIGAINRLPLLTPAAAGGGVKTLREGSGSSGSRTSSNNRPVSTSSPPAAAHRTAMMPLQPQQTARKQRRCWSPELHRRFVNALQKLGGSQVATPKQIRELMQVDGLTNDEVKSHLQKYRLHTRRVPSGSGNHSHNHNQSVVVLGGLWMSQGQDQCNDSSKGSSSGSGSPQSPLHLATRSRGGTSPAEADDSMEDDEDAKSESYSWKSHTHHKQVKVVDV
ncbi:hypothetical protein HN51_031408 [Arachis hypogaea]|uniref:HTH myb-type domain-containing protein n=1 Tax=Arachis hypogaea TaxID=3818 RepID=A0A445B793_ARAHY|nr:transcription factor HRS1 [Arachis hypogaea]QHO16010.1 Myb-like transcription factor family protein [Arachis hypogaea]RYR34534.1 hypothetical protein Ahy_A10g049481 [Arachis hypogaea]